VASFHSSISAAARAALRALAAISVFSFLSFYLEHHRMSTVLDEPTVRRSTAPAERLCSTMAAARVSTTWFGVRKTLSVEQKQQAADAFGAEGDFLSAGKKLLDTRHQAFKAVTSVRNRAISYWKGISLPFPESGIRLIKHDDIAAFDVHLTSVRAELNEAVWNLDSHYGELKSAARARLGSLFDQNDYPLSLDGLFKIEWDFPSVEPPDYLRELHPKLWREQQALAASRFEQAVKLAEDAFIEELSKLVSHLTERLSGEEDGKPKIFRDSVVENLTEFFQRFRQLNIRSNAQLDEMVEQAQQIVRGVKPQQLRENLNVRQEVATQLSGVQSVLDGLLVDRPRRNILRRSK
jgi:hypothetical protein